MNIEKMFENYKRNLLKVKMATTSNKNNKEIDKLKYEIELVEASLKEMDDLDKDIFEFRYIRGLSFSKIALETNFAKTTIYNRIKRKLKELQQLFE